MENSDDKEPELSTSNIVTIAYCQSKKIAGGDDTENSVDNEGTMNLKCFNRMKNLSIIVGMTSGISEAYDSLKKSHETIESILNTTEEQLNEGVNMLSPITNKMVNIFEEPLKSLDQAVCDGFDYLGEKVPQLKSETEEIYETLEEYIKTTAHSVMTRSSSLVPNIKGELHSDKDDESNDTKNPKQG